MVILLAFRLQKLSVSNVRFCFIFTAPSLFCIAFVSLTVETYVSVYTETGAFSVKYENEFVVFFLLDFGRYYKYIFGPDKNAYFSTETLRVDNGSVIVVGRQRTTGSGGGGGVSIVRNVYTIRLARSANTARRQSGYTVTGTVPRSR